MSDRKSYRVIGIMSGSSLDGLDIAEIEFTFTSNPITSNPIASNPVTSNSLESWKLIQAQMFPFPSNILNLFTQATTLPILSFSRFENQLTEFIGECCKSFIHSTKYIEVVGCHGHTIWHLPDEHITIQACNGQMLSTRLSLPVICHFRMKDVSYGGVGTPMAPLADRDLFAGYRAYLNLGGIANISYKDHQQSWKAFDLIPCNQVLNHFAQILGQVYDENGKFAKEGTLSQDLLVFLDNHPYLKSTSPKSLDNTQVYQDWIQPIEKFYLPPKDVLHTYTHFIASQIQASFLPATGVPKKVLISGGGGHNKYLISLLNEDEHLIIESTDADLINYKEAILIGYAAILRYLGLPNFIHSVTGAISDVSGGDVFHP